MRAEPDGSSEPQEVGGNLAIMDSAGNSAKAKAMSSPQVAGAEDAEADLGHILRMAFVDLRFTHGYPALPSGMPFWSKMDFEPGFSFAMFQIFLEQGTDGPRELFAIAEDKQLQELAKQGVAGYAGGMHGMLNILQEYYILHCWAPRARAFDLYREAAWRHQRLRKQITAEDKHFSIAGKLLQKLEAYFESDKFVEEMTPKTAIDAFSKLVAVQRVSAGLPASGPLAANQQPEATSFEMILRNVALRQGAAQQSNGQGAHTHTREMLDQVLTDPTAAANLQEVIIRISGMMTDGQQVQSNERRFPSRNRAEIIDVTEPEFVDVSKSDVPR